MWDVTHSGPNFNGSISALICNYILVFYMYVIYYPHLKAYAGLISIM